VTRLEVPMAQWLSGQISRYARPFIFPTHDFSWQVDVVHQGHWAAKSVGAMKLFWIKRSVGFVKLRVAAFG